MSTRCGGSTRRLPRGVIWTEQGRRAWTPTSPCWRRSLDYRKGRELLLKIVGLEEHVGTEFAAGLETPVAGEEYGGHALLLQGWVIGHQGRPSTLQVHW